jgi:hypothetical protein
MEKKDLARHMGQSYIVEPVHYAARRTHERR